MEEVGGVGEVGEVGEVREVMAVAPLSLSQKPQPPPQFPGTVRLCSQGLQSRGDWGRWEK